MHWSSKRACPAVTTTFFVVEPSLLTSSAVPATVRCRISFLSRSNSKCLHGASRRTGDQLLQVAYQAANGWKNTPNIVICSVRSVNYRLMPYLTDCSTGDGASGLAQLQPALSQSGQWILSAVVSSENGSGHDGGEFDLAATYTSSAPVAGEFWQALADKLKNTPEAFEKAKPSPFVLQGRLL